MEDNQPKLGLRLRMRRTSPCTERPWRGCTTTMVRGSPARKCSALAIRRWTTDTSRSSSDNRYGWFLAVCEHVRHAFPCDLLTCTGQGNTLRLLVTGERNSMPDQAPLPGASPGDTKQAALVSGVTVTGVLAVGFSLCRSRRVAGRHMSC